MIRKVTKGIETAEIAVLFCMFFFLSFAIVADVICRKFFAFSFSWLEELSRYFFIFSSFMGASIAVTRDEHPRMTAVHTFIGEKKANVLYTIVNALCAVFFACMMVVAWTQVMNLVRMGTMTSTLKIPLYLAYLIIPVSMIGMVIRYVLCFVECIKKFKHPGEEAAPQ